MKKIIVAILIIVLAAGAAGGSYFLYKHLQAKKQPIKQIQEVTVEGSVFTVDVGKDFVKHYTENNVVAYENSFRNLNFQFMFGVMEGDSGAGENIYVDGFHFEGDIATYTEVDLSEIAGLDMNAIRSNNFSNENKELILAYMKENKLVGEFAVYTEASEKKAKVTSFNKFAEINKDKGTISFDVRKIMKEDLLKKQQTLCVNIFIMNSPVTFNSGLKNLMFSGLYEFKNLHK